MVSSEHSRWRCRNDHFQALDNTHPTLVVLWCGQLGWTLTAPGGRVGFGGRFDGGPDGDELHSIVVEHGGIRLELQYDLQGGSAAVNGMPVPLPDGHDVILL